MCLEKIIFMGQINLSDLFHHGSHRHWGFFFCSDSNANSKKKLGQFPSDHTFVVFQEKVAGFPQFNDKFYHFVSIISLHARESNSQLYWLY